MNQILGQMLAFALAHFDQFREGAVQRALRSAARLPSALICFLRSPHHARRLQDGVNGDFAAGALNSFCKARMASW